MEQTLINIEVYLRGIMILVSLLVFNRIIDRILYLIDNNPNWFKKNKRKPIGFHKDN